MAGQRRRRVHPVHPDPMSDCERQDLLPEVPGPAWFVAVGTSGTGQGEQGAATGTARGGDTRVRAEDQRGNLAVSQGVDHFLRTGGHRAGFIEAAVEFLQDAGLTRLGYYTDEKAGVFQELKSIGRALGMPTSVLVDPKGCEIGTIAGPAEWNSDDAIKLITAAVAPAAAGL